MREEGKRRGVSRRGEALAEKDGRLSYNLMFCMRLDRNVSWKVMHVSAIICLLYTKHGSRNVGPRQNTARATIFRFRCR
jgi:hypothetical protein